MKMSFCIWKFLAQCVSLRVHLQHGYTSKACCSELSVSVLRLVFEACQAYMVVAWANARRSTSFMKKQQCLVLVIGGGRVDFPNT